MVKYSLFVVCNLLLVIMVALQGGSTRNLLVYVFRKFPSGILGFLFLWLALGLSALTQAHAEGTKQAAPSSSDIAQLLIGDSNFSNFANFNALVDNRLYVHITSASTEQVYIGLSQATSQSSGNDGNFITIPYYFRIMDPNGNVVFGPQQISSANANANTWALATTGPSPIVGASGYTPFTFTPANGAASGDYYIEFSDNTSGATSSLLTIKYWDITVATRTSPKALDGRLWSKNWSFRTPSISQGSDPTYNYYDRPFNGTVYTYSSDGFVNKLNYLNSGFRGLAFTLSFNSTGTANTGNIAVDKQSVTGNQTLTQYKIFFNNPDSLVYPSGTLGTITTAPYILNCSGSSSLCIAYATSLSGTAQILLDFNQTSGAGKYDPGTADVLLYQTITPANGETAPYKRCLSWDGKNGLGATVSTSAAIPIYLSYLQGLLNFPVYDVEYNTNGYVTTSVRPTPTASFTLKIGWDDSNIGAASGSGEPVINVFNRSTTPAHTWTNYNFGNNNTINTFWYGNQVDTNTNIAPVTPSCTFTGPVAVCISSTGNSYNGPSNQDSYTWSITGNGTIAGSSTSQTVSVTAGASGTYTLTLTTTKSTCSSSSSQNITVGLSVAITGISSTCVGTIGLVFTGSAGLSSYAWSITGNGTITSATNGQSVTVTATAIGSFTLSLSVTGNNGACNASTTYSVPVTATCAVNKYLYLSSASQTLTRTDPVATNSTTTYSTSTLSNIAGGITFDNKTTTSAASVNLITLNHTTGSGSNRLMLVGISLKVDKGLPTSVTYGSSTLTQVGSIKNGTNAAVYLYYLLNPTSGTDIVSVNFTQAVSSKGCVIGVVTYSGVDQTTPLGTYATNSGNSTSASVTVSSASTQLVIDVLDARQNTTVTPSSGQTKVYGDIVLSEVDGLSSTKAGASSTTMSWTLGASHEWALLAVPIKPAVVNSTVSFTENPALCSNLTIPAITNLKVTVYPNIVTGSMPSSPNITATLKYGATTIATLTNPSFNSSTGILTWATTTGGAVTVPAGQAIGLDITTAEAGATFKIDYNSISKPSKITIPTSTFINISSIAVYNSTYPGGSAITSNAQGGNSFVRVTVTDPFGATDISSVNMTITDPSSGVTTSTLTSPQIVATTTCGSIYQYKIANHVILGTWNIQAVANEGTEGITSSASTTLIVVANLTPVLQSKQLYLNSSLILNRTDPVSTNDVTLDSSSVLGVGTQKSLYALYGSSTSFYQYSISGNSWSSKAATTATVNQGGSLTYDGTNIYALEGNTTTAFRRYNVGSNTWTTLASTPSAVNQGGALVYAGGYIYAFRGNNLTDFWRYNISTDAWTAMTSAPANVAYGGSLVYDGTNIYAFRGNSLTDFWRYNIGSNTWTTLASTPSAVNQGGALTYDGTYIYGLRGATTNAFWQYNKSTNIWATLSNAPSNVSKGGALAFDGTYIYALQGNIQTPFYRYNISSNVWTSVTSTTSNVSDGGALVTYGDGLNGVSNVSFTQSPNMCSGFTLAGNQTVTVTTYVGVTGGSMPTNPNITATLKYGSTTIVTLGTPTYNSGAGTLIWTGTVANGGVTVPASQAVVLNITTSQSGVAFKVYFSAKTSPSKIDMPTYTYILIDTLSAYTAAYPSGTIISLGTAGTTRYLRAYVSDPFGTSDITGLNLIITTPSGSKSTVTPSSVGSIGCTKIYEYALTSPVAGDYIFAATAAEGTEGVVTDYETATLFVCSPTVSASVTTSPTCYLPNSGVIDYTVSGGNGPYTYSWSNGTTSGSGFGTTISGLSAATYSITVTTSGGCTGTASVVISSLSAPTVNSSFTNPSCNGLTNGTITLTVSGGVSPYTYYWQDGNTNQNRTGLYANGWSVTVTGNNGCTTTKYTTLTEPTVVKIIGSTTDPTCYGGTNGLITLTVSGGSGSGYTYIWENSTTTQNRTNLADSTYDVTVTDGLGCTNTNQFIISQPGSITLTTTLTPITCTTTTGSITLSASTGVSPYNYDWADVAGTNNSANRTNIGAGTYTIIVTDANGCTKSNSYTLTGSSTILGVACAKTDPTTIKGTHGTASVTTSGGTAPFSYLWSSGASTSSISGLSFGTYTVTVTDAYNCTVSCSVTLNDPVCTLTATASGTNVKCNGGSTGAASVTVSGNSGTVTYAWNTSATTASLSNIAVGTYTVTVTDNLCQKIASVVISAPPTLSATTAVVTTNCNNGTGVATVTATGGTKPYTYSWSNGATSASVYNLSAGGYNVTVTDANGCTATGAATIVFTTVPMPLSPIEQKTKTIIPFYRSLFSFWESLRYWI